MLHLNIYYKSYLLKERQIVLTLTQVVLKFLRTLYTDKRYHLYVNNEEILVNTRCQHCSLLR